MWERENAERFIDEYYDMTFNAAQVISIATANSTDKLAESLVDRLLVLRVPPPNRDQRRGIAVQIHRKVAERIGLQALDSPSDEALAMLQELTPRRMAQAIELGLPHAVRQGRASLTAADLKRSLSLAERWQTKAGQIGFVRRLER